MDALSLSLLLGSPWLAMLTLLWPWGAPDEQVPPSAAESARRRLWS